MKSGFDINRIQEDGYLIFPLSMNRLATGQNPEVAYSRLVVSTTSHFFLSLNYLFL